MGIEPLIALKVMGILLTLSVVVQFLGIAIASRGNFSGYQATMRGIEGVGESADVLRKGFWLSQLHTVLAISGYGMFTVLLREAGDNGVSMLALGLILFSEIFIIAQGTFHSSVTVWAAKELSRTGTVPDLFQPLWRWMYSTVQQTYTNLALFAYAAYGWAILQTGILPAWLGWASIGWTAIWLPLFIYLGDNLPLVLFVPPLLIGITALLV